MSQRKEISKGEKKCLPFSSPYGYTLWKNIFRKCNFEVIKMEPMKNKKKNPNRNH